MTSSETAGHGHRPGGLAPPNTTLYALVSLAAGMLCAYLGSLLQMNADWLAGLGFSGFFVSDAMSLESSVRLAWQIDWNNWPNLNTFIGVVFLYFPILIFGELGAAIVNIILLFYASLFFAYSVRDIYGKISSFVIFSVSTIAVYSNIYILEVINFPNKEIPLILITNMFVYFAICRRDILVPLALIVISYYFRDGFSIILSIIFAVVLIRLHVGKYAALIAAAVLALLLSTLSIQSLSWISSAFDRNATIGEGLIGERFAALGQIASYIARLVGNAANLGLRPQLEDEIGGIHLLAVGYWQFGIVILAGLLWAMKTIATPHAREGALALLLVVALLGISYGSFVQPRYMMPLIYWLSLGLAQDHRIRLIALAACTLAPIFFWALDGLPPLATSTI
ncbi:hypothetical protein [Devosia alba]|uniref:hypothetical protein n=1 Tax=Devosia alba TaxID=3152360 RepID=UPI003263B596